MHRIDSSLLLILLLLVFAQCKSSNQSDEKKKVNKNEFTTLSNAENWKLAFEDKYTVDWQQNWTLDGLIATVENSEKGMHFSAGPEYKNDAHHAVLWTKKSFEGNLKITYDYTRTDTTTRLVNILYVQATGKGEGPYTKDISQWKELREVPSMRTYFNNMSTLHISYAAFLNISDTSCYVRARRYPVPEGGKFQQGTRIAPSYDNRGYFKYGETYHITVIKTEKQLLFQMEGKDGKQLFSWDLSDSKPIVEGRIGLRHMYTRSAIYKNFKVYQINS